MPDGLRESSDAKNRAERWFLSRSASIVVAEYHPASASACAARNRTYGDRRRIVFGPVVEYARAGGRFRVLRLAKTFGLNAAVKIR